MGQIIITISREFGSGGHKIATILAEKLGLGLYDKNILEHVAQKNNISFESLHKYDESKRKGFTRTLGGYTTSVQEHVAQIEFDYIKEKADSGESFVVVGRCGDAILRDRPEVFTIFVRSDTKSKSERVSKLYNVSVDEAKRMSQRIDKTRKAYHNFYSTIKWGDSRGYDICVNSAKIGIEETAEMLYDYIKKYM